MIIKKISLKISNNNKQQLQLFYVLASSSENILAPTLFSMCLT